MKLSNKTNEVWDNAKDCNCDQGDCYNNHKLCAICFEKVIYGAHVSNQPNSKYAWDTDHKWPKSWNGSNDINNLQVTHIVCNRNKGNFI